MQTLTARQRITWVAHLWKAITRTRFKPLIPVFRSHIPANGVVIDVGANAGYFSKIFSKLAPEGHIYAFEPGTYARSILTQVIRFNKLDNVTLLPYGLGDKASTQVLHLPLKVSGSLGYGLGHIGDDKQVDARNTVSEKIEIKTLDSFISEKNIPRVDFIKIDIEGWELRALEGSRQTINKHSPVLALEMVDTFLRRAGDSAEKMWDFLLSCNYEIHSFDENGQVKKLEAMPDLYTDLLCLPKKS